MVVGENDDPAVRPEPGRPSAAMMTKMSLIGGAAAIVFACAPQPAKPPASHPASSEGARSERLEAARAFEGVSWQPASQPSSQPASRPSSQPASQPASRPASQPSSQPASRPSSQPSSQPSGHEHHSEEGR